MESAKILWLKGKLRKYNLLFNIYAGYIVCKRKLYLNKWHLKTGKRFAYQIYMPSLSYIGIDIVSHCNLKCKGCSHFSPLADQKFVDIEEYRKDMQRLSFLFHNIEVIRLLGGEPLLHPKIAELLFITRNIFKNARISIATNGVLLYSMQADFWEACRINQIKLNMSVYPPFYEKEEKLVKYVESRGVIIYTDRQHDFRVLLNSKGDSDPLKAFEFCRSTAFVPYLFDGKVFTCSMPVVVNYFNRKFGFEIPATGGISIHDKNINGWDVLISISKHGETCRYCITHEQKFPWQASELSIKDWSI